MAEHPNLIQGGMGVAVSDWRLARAVSTRGQLGVVSGTGLTIVLTRRLQLGDEGGHVRRALRQFPGQKIVDRILQKYFIEGGKAESEPFRPIPMFSLKSSSELDALSAAAGFVEIYLAKEGHDFPVGINFLAKISMANPSGLYGAILAGVDYVLVGAGIPIEYPEMIARLVRHEEVALEMIPDGGDRSSAQTFRFSPRAMQLDDFAPRTTPFFFAIVSSPLLARTLLKRAKGPIDGFVVEAASAGGHNAPPRGAMRLDDNGEPIYGDRDAISADSFVALERPFWLAGARHSSEALAEALQAGAAGIQIGTPFAYCLESGYTEELKGRVRDAIRSDQIVVFKDPELSPTGFPFNVVKNVGLSDGWEMEETRKCDLGFLRQMFQKEDGNVGYRCPAARRDYVRSGGKEEDTHNKRCLCNALAASVGLGQIRDGVAEAPLLTAGNDVRILRDLFGKNAHYTAEDVLNHFLGVGSQESGRSEPAQSVGT